MMITSDNLYTSPSLTLERGMKWLIQTNLFMNYKVYLVPIALISLKKNIEQTLTVARAQENFAAAKVTVHGDVTVQQLEKAGAFDGIKVRTEAGEDFSYQLIRPYPLDALYLESHAL